MIPPNEKPTRLTGAGGETTSSSPDDTMSASASAVSTPGGSPESPKPGRSGTHTVKWRASGMMLRAQGVHEPLPPCSSTTGGPAPPKRQTIYLEPPAVYFEPPAMSAAGGHRGAGAP